MAYRNFMEERTAKDSHYARLRRRHRSNNAAAPLANAPRKQQFHGETPPAGRLWLYGFHTVEAALQNPRRRLHHLFLTKNAYDRLSRDGFGSAPRLPQNESDSAALAANLGLAAPIELIEPKQLDRLLGSQAVHQGIALETDSLKPQKREDFSDSSLILLLDQITDPHNVGAIMRSAVAFNTDFFITTARHSPQESGVLAKSASGALEKIDHLAVRNLSETMEKLKQAGFHIIGLDSAGEQLLETSFNGQKIALVLGAEGKGLRQKTRQTADSLARLDMPGAIKSLNVSNAAAIALYAAHRHRLTIK